MKKILVAGFVLVASGASSQQLIEPGKYQDPRSIEQQVRDKLFCIANPTVRACQWEEAERMQREREDLTRHADQAHQGETPEQLNERLRAMLRERKD